MEITRLVKHEWPLLLIATTTLLFLMFGKNWFVDLSNPVWFVFILVWLFGTILLSAFAVVRHADAIAFRLGEPLGTLVLTLSMSGMEMMMIAAVMYSTQGASSLGRDTMFAILMIVLNGLVGTCLLLGGLRYHEQTTIFMERTPFSLCILPLSVLGLILPSFTISSPGPTYSVLQSTFLVIMSIGLYGVFLGIQTTRHSDYFVFEANANETKNHNGDSDHTFHIRSTKYHAVLLLTYVFPIVLLAKQIAVPINYGINVLGAPAALGGLLVAIFILSPECMAAARAALANKLQRSINLSLGTALSSISLTIPAVLIIGFIANKTIILGLAPADIVLLLLTLSVGMITFALERTNVLFGAVHLLLFLAYLMLIFEK